MLELCQEETPRYERLLRDNDGCQEKLVLLFKSRVQGERQKDSADVTKEAEKRYAKALARVNAKHAEKRRAHAVHVQRSLELRRTLDEKHETAMAADEEFLELKRRGLRQTEYTRTGKPLPPSWLDKSEEKMRVKEKDVEHERIRFISLRNKLRKYESALKHKEQLDEGLHLIDFEQLKIENQAHNEKIEERNEELLKLRKKITTTVQVLTHVKEKLQFVQTENHQLRRDLEELDAQVVAGRTTLGRLKVVRDNIRRDNQQLREAGGLVNSVDLLRDFERRNGDVGTLEVELKELKEQHGRLTGKAVAHRSRTAAIAEQLVSAQ